MLDMLLPVASFPDPTPRGGLSRAIDLASGLGGQLTALVHEVVVPPLGNPLAAALADIQTVALQAEATSRARGAELTRDLQELAGQTGLALEVQPLRCRPEVVADSVARAARTHDLTLLVTEPSGAGQRAMTEAVLFDSGGPVILLPADETPTQLETIAIAWDGSRAAARAVRDALPILGRAGTVFILTAGDDKAIDAAGTEGLQRRLRHHGIANEHRDIRRAGRPIGQALLAEAEGLGAGLLVMGAFGRNRMQQFILGGATATVLDRTRMPVLLSH